MKGIVEFCRITHHGYEIEALPNGGLRLTIDCVYPPHTGKIEWMAIDKGYTVDTSDCGEIIIYSDEGWEEMVEKFLNQPCTPNIKDITIKNRHGQEFDFESVCDHMDAGITSLHHRELDSSTSPQDYYNKYCKLHKEIRGKDFFVETDLVIKNKHGEPIEYEDAVDYMDDDIREYLHHQLAPCPPQYFYEEYCKLHKEIYNEEYLTEKEYVEW
jgi:hypothetical protein